MNAIADGRTTPTSAQRDIQRAMDTCVDGMALRAYLQPLLAPHGAVETVRVLQTRRSASRGREPNPLTALYEVDLRETPHASARKVVLHGKVYRDGASAAETAAPSVHVPALDLRLWPWPHDAALTQLPRLLEPGAAAPYLGVAATSVRAVRYLPSLRATLKYTDDAGHEIYAKAFDDDRGEAVHHRFTWFWQRAQQDATLPTVARPLAYVAADRTLWQSGATGTPLRQCLDADSSSQPWQALARALATVHDAPLSLAGSERRDTAHWLREAARRSKKITRAVPHLAAQANAVVAAIEAAAARLPALELRLIHGDFHHDQIWVDDGRIVLFDFDEFSLGDPMEDLAEFVVKLPDEPHGDKIAQACIRAYAEVAPTHFSTERLVWHRTVQQLLQASRAFVFQVADWRGRVERRLERAQRLADEMT